MSLDIKQLARDFCREKGFNNVEYIEAAMRRAIEELEKSFLDRERYTWIRQAASMGGRLTIVQALVNKSIFNAVMEWPGTTEKPVKGAIATTIDGALRNLEEALLEDAAEEMRQQGAV